MSTYLTDFILQMNLVELYVYMLITGSIYKIIDKHLYKQKFIIFNLTIFCKHLYKIRVS